MTSAHGPVVPVVPADVLIVCWESGGNVPPFLGLARRLLARGHRVRLMSDAAREWPLTGRPGPAIDPASLVVPSNVRAVSFQPHNRVLPHASVMVTHGGHGSVIRALASNVPLVVMPMGRDQADNAVRVVLRGAGLRLRPGASPAAIRRAIARVLAEPSFAAAAAALGARIRMDAERSRAVEEIELAARSHS